MYIKSKLAEHVLSTEHKHTNLQTNQQILHKASNGPKFNKIEQFKIHTHHKTQKNEMLNDQLTYDPILYDITQQQDPHYKLHTPPTPAFKA